MQNNSARNNSPLSVCVSHKGGHGFKSSVWSLRVPSLQRGFSLRLPPTVQRHLEANNRPYIYKEPHARGEELRDLTLCVNVTTYVSELDLRRYADLGTPGRCLIAG